MDIQKLHAAHKILIAVVDRPIGLKDLDLHADVEPIPPVVEVDGLTPHRDYCRDCECTEGMDW